MPETLMRHPSNLIPHIVHLKARRLPFGGYLLTQHHHPLEARHPHFGEHRLMPHRHCYWIWQMGEMKEAKGSGQRAFLQMR